MDRPVEPPPLCELLLPPVPPEAEPPALEVPPPVPPVLLPPLPPVAPPLDCEPPVRALLPPELLLPPPEVPPVELEVPPLPAWLLLLLLDVDEPPLALLPPESPPLERDELDERLPPELDWLPPLEDCPPLPLRPALLLLLDAEELLVFLPDPPSSQPAEQAKSTVRTVALIRMAAPYFSSWGKKPAGTCSVR